MNHNFDQPSDPSPRSIYDEDRTCDPAEKFAQSTLDRFERLEKTILAYREDVAKLRAEIRDLKDSLAAYAAMQGN